MDANYQFLRKVQMFEELPDHDLEQLCRSAEEVRLQAGEILFSEGSPGDRAYVIRDGLIEIYKSSEGRDVQLAIREPGEVIGEMSLLESVPRTASGRALRDSLLLAITSEQLEDLLNSSPSASRVMLHTFTNRLRSTELALKQNEKMAQLGSLTAGIAHELNNPAAAARRGAEQLVEVFGRHQKAQVRVNELRLNQEQAGTLLELDRKARESVSKVHDLDSLARSDREAGLEAWLEEKGVDDAWEIAPLLVNLGFEKQELEQLYAGFPIEQVPAVVEWLVTTSTMYSLLDEIGQGASRISEIVKGLKTYVYLDQAPIQEVSVEQGLDNTLVILRHKIKDAINIKREYDPDLPRIQAYGSELNQVWTNILDNAIDAVDGKGEITIRTSYQEPWVMVEIEDDGPGIPEEIQSKIFNPFFTTKPVGKGTGQGLNITYGIVQKHGGEIGVFSQPGKTRFEVKLPVNFEAILRRKK